MTEYLGQTTDFILGQDFLTWLWYRSESRAGMFEDRNGRPFAAYMEQRVSVQGGEGDSLETATVSGAMSELKEARMGLITGKKVTRALLRFERESESWQVSLKAENFSLNALKTPKVEKAGPDDDPDAVLLERLYLIDACLELLDGLYAEFIGLRLNPAAWNEEIANMRVWMQRAAETD
ncbi:MAG: hypothetical protein IJD04_02150 [Desulfovibrionaceae bacterium]|nr:hypothetical protein [Desulfovibrionaceae bacterium]